MFHKAKNLMGRLVRSNRAKTLALMVLAGSTAAFAQNAAGDYSAGTTALSTVTTEIAKYVPYVVKLCYAIAGVVAVVGSVSVYISMNNEEQDVKKKIMMVVGACIFLVAAAQALPLFFGL
jgi:NADH:ubiquinone oxidoreductase subunit H